MHLLLCQLKRVNLGKRGRLKVKWEEENESIYSILMLESHRVG